MRWIRNSGLILSGLMLLVNQAMADGEQIPVQPGDIIQEQTTSSWVSAKPRYTVEEQIPEQPDDTIQEQITSNWVSAKPRDTVGRGQLIAAELESFNCKQNCTLQTMECNSAEDTGFYSLCAKKCFDRHSFKNKKIKKALRNCEALIQNKRYLGAIMDVLYKRSPSGELTQDIRGFFVQILREKKQDGTVKSYKPGKAPVVFLPYLVVLRKELVAIPAIRNSNGTIMENLDINLNKLIEFDGLSSVKHEIQDPVTQQNELYDVITARPAESKIIRRIW